RLGKVLAKLEKYAEAAEAFHAAAALYADPLKANDPSAAARLDWNLTGLYTAKGDPATALVHLEAFLKLRPQATEPFERLASLLRQAGREGEVLVALRRYHDRDPKNLPLLAVYAAELARDPANRRQADAAFTQLFQATNDPKVIRVVLRAQIETGRAAQVVSDLDAAYQVVKAEDSTAAEK